MSHLLEVDNLKVHFFLDEGTVRAVDGVSFAVDTGKSLGIVGESGSGKSVIGQSILRIVPAPGKIVAGKILLAQANGNGDSKLIDLVQVPPHSRVMREIRGRDVAMIFQEPMNSFSPLHTIGSQITEALRLHSDVSPAEAREQAVEILAKVGIPRPQYLVDV
ncbi:MAG: ATP-binding cassette domain-containing protein, partial [Desulfomonilaceae bacterium]